MNVRFFWSMAAVRGAAVDFASLRYTTVSAAYLGGVTSTFPLTPPPSASAEDAAQPTATRAIRSEPMRVMTTSAGGRVAGRVRGEPVRELEVRDEDRLDVGAQEERDTGHEVDVVDLGTSARPE